MSQRPSQGEAPGRTSQPGADDPMHKKAAFLFSKSLRSMANASVSVSSNWQKVKENVVQSNVGKAAASTYSSASKKSADMATWARTYYREVKVEGGFTLSHKSHVIQTESDTRGQIQRGDLIEVGGELYVVSTDEQDPFTSTSIPLSDPETHQIARRKGPTVHDDLIKCRGDRVRDAYKKASAGVNAVGTVAAGAASIAAQRTTALADAARFYEQEVAIVNAWRKHNDVLYVSAVPKPKPVARPSEKLETIDDILGEDEPEVDEEVEYYDLTTILSRGDQIKLNGQVYEISMDERKPFNEKEIPICYVDTKLPARNEEGRDVSGMALAKVGDRWNDVKKETGKKTETASAYARGYKEPVGQASLLAHKSSDIFVDEDMRKKLRVGDQITVAEETYTIKLLSRESITLDRPREGQTVSSSKYKLRAKVKFFQKGSDVCYVTADVSKKLSRGQSVEIGGETYQISSDPERTFDASQIPLETARTLPTITSELREVEDCLVSVAEGSSYAQTTSSLLGAVSRGDKVMIDGETFVVSKNIFRRFTATQLPLDHAPAHMVMPTGIQICEADESALEITLPMIDPVIYVHGDRYEDFAKSRRQLETKQRVKNREREEAVKEYAENAAAAVNVAGNAAADKLDDYSARASRKIRPATEKLSETTAVAVDKAAAASAPVYRKTVMGVNRTTDKAMDVADSASRTATQTYSKHSDKFDAASQKLDKGFRSMAKVLGEIQEGVHEGYDAGAKTEKKAYHFGSKKGK